MYGPCFCVVYAAPALRRVHASSTPLPHTPPPSCALPYPIEPACVCVLGLVFLVTAYASRVPHSWPALMCVHVFLLAPRLQTDASTADAEFVFPNRPLPWLLRGALLAVIPEPSSDTSSSSDGAGAPAMTAQTLVLCCHPAVSSSITDVYKLWKKVCVGGGGGVPAPFSVPVRVLRGLGAL